MNSHFIGKQKERNLILSQLPHVAPLLPFESLSSGGCSQHVFGHSIHDDWHPVVPQVYGFICVKGNIFVSLKAWHHNSQQLFCRPQLNHSFQLFPCEKQTDDSPTLPKHKDWRQ